MIDIKNFEQNKIKVEQEYSNLKDEDIIEDLVRIDAINDERVVHIIDFKNRKEIMKLSGRIGEICTDYQKINTMFDLVLYDTSDILSYKNNIEKNNKTSNDNKLNRLTIHLLSSGRLFVDSLEIHLKRKYGKTSNEYINFKNTLSKKYDEEFVYRFFYDLRNFTQHVGFPISAISSEIVRKPETDQEYTKLKSYLNIDYLLNSNFDWKKIIRDDLLDFQNKKEELDMFGLIERYYLIMTEIMFEAKKLFLDLNHRYLLSLIKKWELLGLKSNQYAISKITKYNLIHNPSKHKLSSVNGRYDIEMIYKDMSKIVLVNITNDSF